MATFTRSEDEYDIGIIRNDYIHRIDSFLKTGKIVTITGVRRSGKSTLMKQYAAKLVRDGVQRNNLLFINFEEAEFGNPDLELLLKIYDAYCEIIKPSGKPYIFLDEIQNVSGWEKFVRSLNEKKEAHIIISGSNEKMLSQEFSTVLTGRQLVLHVFPFSFREFLMQKNIDQINKQVISTKGRQIRQHFRVYLKYGGFPELVISDDDDIKLRLIDSYITDITQKDIVARYNIRKIRQMYSLMKYYIQNYSNPITFNSICKFIDLDIKTIGEYSHYFEETNLIFFLSRFSYGFKEHLKSYRKVYLVDIGLDLTNRLNVSKNSGRMIENLVAIKLKHYELSNPSISIFYWKDNNSKKEVDFLIKKGQNVIEILQVCWNVSEEKTRERESSALLASMKVFGLKKGMIITEDTEYSEKIDGNVIEYIPIWKWLMG